MWAVPFAPGAAEVVTFVQSDTIADPLEEGLGLGVVALWLVGMLKGLLGPPFMPVLVPKDSLGSLLIAAPVLSSLPEAKLNLKPALSGVFTAVVVVAAPQGALVLRLEGAVKGVHTTPPGLWLPVTVAGI